MQVLISGGGVAGPVLAYFLARASHKLISRIVVVERRPRSGQLLGQNIDIKEEGRLVIEAMGVLDKVKEYNTTEIGTRFRDSKGNILSTFMADKAGFTQELEILRSDLTAILTDAAESTGRVEVWCDEHITHIDQHTDGPVAVQFNNRNGRHHFDLVVGADGHWSKTREMTIATLPGCSRKEAQSDVGVYMAFFTVPRIESDSRFWEWCLIPRRRSLFLRPDNRGTTRAMLAVMPCDEAEKKALDSVTRDGGNVGDQMQLVHSLFANAGWQVNRVLQEMDRSEDFYMSDNRQVCLPKYFDGRVVLLGDAAYAPTVFTGMGTTLALTGAYVLAGELLKEISAAQHVGKPYDLQRPLQSYQDYMKPLVEKRQMIPKPLLHLFYLESAWAQYLFHRFLSFVGFTVNLLPSKLLERTFFSVETTYTLPQYEGFTPRKDTS